MRNHPVRKGLVAVATVLAMFLVLASPASAVGATVTAGTLTVHTNPAQVFDLAPDGLGPCPDKPSTLDVTFNGNGTWSATGGFSGQFQLGNPPAGQWYQADFTLLAASGNWTGSGPYPMTSAGPNHITIRVVISAIDATDCDKTPTLCTLVGRMVLTSGSQHNGSIPPSATNTTVLNGTTNTTGGLALVASPCQQPFSSMNGAHATVAGLTFTY